MAKQQCIFLSLVEIPDGIPAHFIDNGVLYLDVDDQTAVSLTKAPQELTSNDKISDEAVRNFSLPVTPKNEFTLRSFTSPIAYKRSYAPIPIIAIGGGLAYKVSYLNVIRSNDERIECQLIRDKNNWLVLASQTKLRDVDWGDPFQFEAETVKQTWDNWEYNDDPSRGMMFAPGDYGKFLNNNKIVAEDIRPLFNPIFLLKTAFCYIGYEIDSPLFQDQILKQSWVYYLRPDYGSIPELLRLRDVGVNVILQSTGSHVFDEVYDEGDVFNLGVYSAPVVADFHFDFDIVLQNTSGSAAETVWVELIRIKANGDEEILHELDFFVAAQNDNLPDVILTLKNQRIEALNVILDPNDQVILRMREPIRLVEYTATGVFWTKTKKTYYKKGDEIPFGTVFRNDTILDLYKGILHFFAGKNEPEINLRKIQFYQPYEVTYYKGTDEESGPYEGFYRSNAEAIDLTQAGLCEGGTLINERADPKRFQLYQFKDSSDAKIAELDLELPLYSKLVDLGEEYKNDTEVHDNPIFEPTLSEFSKRYFGGNGVPLYLPHMWDNTQNELSYDIGPRIMYCPGKTTVYKTKPDGSLIACRFRWETDEDVFETEYPVLFDKCEEKVAATNNDIPIVHFIYGDDPNGYDFYTWHYRVLLLSSLFSSKIQAKVFLTPINYRKTNFRDKYKVPFRGRQFFAKALLIGRYDPCSAEAADIVFRPDVGIDGICPGDIGNNGGDPPNPCNLNAPNIIITPDCGNAEVTATLGGSVTSVVQSEQWMISVNGGPLMAYTPGSPISGSTETVKFIYDAIYTDGCTAHLERTFTFGTICNLLQPTMVFDYNNATNCVSAMGVREDVEECTTIENDSWEYKIDNGAGYGSYALYTEGEEICNFQCIMFKWIGEFGNGCPDFLLEQEFCAPPPICGNQPVISCNSQPDGSIIPSITGTINSEISFIIWNFTFNEESEIYSWSGNSPLVVDGIYHLRALVKFCDGCPEICLQADCEVTTEIEGDPDPKCQEWEVYITNGADTDEYTIPARIPLPDPGTDREEASKNLFVITDGTIKIKDHPDGYAIISDNKLKFPYDLEPWQSIEVRYRRC